MIKKICIILSIIMFSLPLFSCDPPMMYHYDCLQEVINIELIEFETDEIIKRSYKVRDIEIENIKIIETLPDCYTETFIDDLTDIYIIGYYTHPDNPEKLCIKINFKNNTFELISENRLVVKYEENGKVLEYVGILDDSECFNNLANKYFVIGTEISE